MKILKYLLFLILLVIIGSAIYFGTQDGEYVVTDSVTIAAPAEVVFNKINDFKSWEQWTPWKQEDSSIVFNYAEKSTGEGSSLAWDSKNSGTLTTTKVIPNKEIHQELTFESPMGKRKAEMVWTLESLGDSTKVTWETKGEHTLMDKTYNSIKGSDFVAKTHSMNRQGLTLLAQEVVADMKKYSINVDGVTQFGGGYYMYTTSVAKQNEVIEKSIPMMAMVKDFVTRNKLNVSGAPFILYNDIDPINNTVILSTCIPLKERVITPENSPVVSGFMEPVSAVKVSLKGSYDHLPEALRKGEDYIRENALQRDLERKIFEVFITDPAVEPNPAQLVTEVFIPIQTGDEPTNSFMEIN